MIKSCCGISDEKQFTKTYWNSFKRKLTEHVRMYALSDFRFPPEMPDRLFAPEKGSDDVEQQRSRPPMEDHCSRHLYHIQILSNCNLIAFKADKMWIDVEKIGSLSIENDIEKCRQRYRKMSTKISNNVDKIESVSENNIEKCLLRHSKKTFSYKNCRVNFNIK